MPGFGLTLTVGSSRLPMRGDDQERLRPLGQRRDEAREIVAQAVPGVRAEGRRKLDPEARTAAMRHEDRGLAGSGHGNLGLFAALALVKPQTPDRNAAPLAIRSPRSIRAA